MKTLKLLLIVICIISCKKEVSQKVKINKLVYIQAEAVYTNGDSIFLSKIRN